MARSSDFLYRYRDILNNLRSSKDSGNLPENLQRRKEEGLSKRQERRTAARRARFDIARDKAAAAAAGNQYVSPRDQAANIAAIPQEYVDKYGSRAGDMYAASQVQAADLNKRYAALGVTPQDVEFYGSDAINAVRARQLNTNQFNAVNEALTAGNQEMRDKALAAGMSSAASAGIPAARAGKDAYKQWVTKEFARWGNSPNVFGMKDLQELRLRGESDGDIRNLALTIGKVGPRAQKELGLGYLNRAF